MGEYLGSPRISFSLKDNMNIKQTLEKILIEEMEFKNDVSLLTEDRPIQSLGMDSMFLVQLVYLLEDDYNVTLTTREILDVATYGDLLTLLESKMPVPAAGAPA
jgi:acyl carrier protein